MSIHKTMAYAIAESGRLVAEAKEIKVKHWERLPMDLSQLPSYNMRILTSDAQVHVIHDNQLHGLSDRRNINVTYVDKLSKRQTVFCFQTPDTFCVAMCRECGYPNRKGWPGLPKEITCIGTEERATCQPRLDAVRAIQIINYVVQRMMHPVIKEPRWHARPDGEVRESARKEPTEHYSVIGVKYSGSSGEHHDGPPKTPHVRRGHMRHYKSGKAVWIEEINVHGGAGRGKAIVK